tara:strand:- start:670 stop:801 length:132 start_codon:yes stop_codon:yes gene_type:complete
MKILTRLSVAVAVAVVVLVKVEGVVSLTPQSSTFLNFYNINNL